MEVVRLMRFSIPPRFHRLTRLLVALALVPALTLSAMARQARTGASVRVTAHDEAERAVAAVIVELKRNGAVVTKMTTDEKGVAEFANVAPGTYEVVIS